MVEVNENSAVVNAQRANDMRESSDIASGVKSAPTAQANDLVRTNQANPGTTDQNDLVRTNQAIPVTNATTTVPPPEPSPTAELSSLHTRLLIAGVLVVILFILWIYQRKK